jgi:hypothetical protein
MDGGIGDDDGVACSNTRLAAHDARRAAGLSGRQHCRNADSGEWEATAVRTPARGPDSAFKALRGCGRMAATR